MSENFFQIDKKDVVSKFKAYAKKHSERSDEYNPKNAKQTANHRNYFVLDRIRALYHWIIKEAKLDLRRMYIHNDKEFKEVLGKLESYARNKIKLWNVVYGASGLMGSGVALAIDVNKSTAKTSDGATMYI